VAIGGPESTIVGGVVDTQAATLAAGTSAIARRTRARREMWGVIRKFRRVDLRPV
jgi:hypothetical protein